jgi:D-inositol-3-phosphate glycosyltransferase
MKKLLWIGDAACPSGFAKATHAILDALSHHQGGQYDVTVLGLNYRGDPHGYPYPIYAAGVEGDGLGVRRLIWMCDFVKPDVIVIQNDGWHVPYYMQRLRAKKTNGEYAFPEHAAIPVVAIVAVDGKNFRGEWLDGVDLAIFWSKFAQDEARVGGYAGPSEVIPLGVDLSVYRPLDRTISREGLPEEMREAFIVGSVNRNQPRKRWDLTVRYFAIWIKQLISTSFTEDELCVAPVVIKDAWLYLHAAPTGDNGPDVRQLMHYYGVFHRLALVQPEVFYGASEEEMAITYNRFDVCISTSQGEGFGLTILEAMACGIPPIVPDSSAPGDWAKDAAWLVPCTTTAINPVAPGLNVIGAVPDQTRFVNALQRLYTDKRAYETNRQAALERAQEPRFRWANIGERYAAVIRTVLGEGKAHQASEAEWQDLGRPKEVTA